MTTFPLNSTFDALTVASGTAGSELNAAKQLASGQDAKTARAEEVRAKYTEFVGKTFFSQLLKAMRSTQGKPAYFHGGRSEEVFQGQLDQLLVDNLSEVSADGLAQAAFEHQFPHLAEVLRQNSRPPSGSSLAELDSLRRM